MQDRQALAKKIKETSNISKEIQRNKRQVNNELDDEMVKTYETF